MKSSRTVVEEHLADLFERLPMLSGFALHEDLEVIEVLRGRTFARAVH